LKVIVIDDRGRTAEYDNFVMVAVKEEGIHGDVATVLVNTNGNPAYALGLLRGLSSACEQLQEKVATLVRPLNPLHDFFDGLRHKAASGGKKQSSEPFMRSKVHHNNHQKCRPQHERSR